MPKSMKIDIVADTNPEVAAVTGRNGTASIREVRVWSVYEDRVYIDGVSAKRGNVINGGISLDPAAMDTICDMWIKTRRRLAAEAEEEAA